MNFNDGANLKFPRCNQKQVCNFSLKELFLQSRFAFQMKTNDRKFQREKEVSFEEVSNVDISFSIIIFNCTGFVIKVKEELKGGEKFFNLNSIYWNVNYL